MDLHLCFVCGAADPVDDEPPKLRRSFLTWIQLNEPKIVCVMAENAVTDLLRQVDERMASKDLSVIEETIASTVDSLLMFPESPGSFAELGLFSANTNICQKMLVAVAHEYQGDSFIILGPIKRINSQSSFSPQPLIVSADRESSFSHIRDRLLGEERRARSYAKRFAHGEWKDYSPREQLAIVDKITDLTGILTQDDLFDLINKSFGKYEKSNIRLLLGLLASMNRIRRSEMGDIIRISAGSRMPFINGGGPDAVDTKASWGAAYAEHLPEAIAEFEQENRELL